MSNSNLTPIQQFYYGKNIFLTGVTGFLGKVLLEKILRCCPGVGTIYLFMREKRGKTPDERLESIWNCDLFNPLRNELPQLKKKIKVIYGDLEKPCLGISEEDAEILKDNIEIIFHTAARVRWDDPLKIAATCHIVAIKSMMELLKGLKHLKVFMYVSTSYVHRDPDLTVPEYVVKKQLTPEKLLDALEWMDDETTEAMSKSILKGGVNSYLLTKALAENVIENERGKIPTGIVRPCLISPTYKDPFPGWCDTIQGMQGLMLAAAKGFLRTLYCPSDMRVNLIPVDVVANTCLNTAWHTATNRPDNVLVVNCVIEYDKLPLAGENLLNVAMSKRTKYPLAQMYRYPDFTVYHQPIFYYIHAFFDHYIPAVIGDTFLFIFTGKTIMIRLYKKINFLYGVFIGVGLQPWICKMKNFSMIKDELSEEDSEIFPMDSDDLDWEKYIDDMFYMGRKVLAKEDPSNIPYAKKKAKIWLYVTSFLKWAIILYFIYMILSLL